MNLKLFLAVSGIGFLMVPDAFSAPGVQPWNRPCIRFYSERKKKPNYKAFAVATSSYQQSCGGAWGAKSVKAAQDAAKKWCKRHAEGASCVIMKSE